MTADPSQQTLDPDERMMRRALELAARGVGQVSPGPLVGCVIAAARGEVVGEGFYAFDSAKHAETVALEQAGGRARGATAYVTLEPHAHWSRTPPCTEALIRAGVARVVVAVEDPNRLVSGRGLEELREAGVEVTVGVLTREAERQNEKYLTSLRKLRPFVHLKLACSLDGRIATSAGHSRWISSEKSRARVHRLRHEYDAILIGSGTAVADDPLLTDRSGLPRRRPLVRIVLDNRLRLGLDSNLVRTREEAPLIIFTSHKAESWRAGAFSASGIEVVVPSGTEFITYGVHKPIQDEFNLDGIMEVLDLKNIRSLLIEGGAGVAGAFLRAGLVDKVSFFIAPLILGSDGLGAVGGAGPLTVPEAARLRDVETHRHGDDVEVTGYLLK